MRVERRPLPGSNEPSTRIQQRVCRNMALSLCRRTVSGSRGRAGAESDLAAHSGETIGPGLLRSVLSGPPMRYDGGVEEFRRITMDPEIMGGKPCIRGMRVTVGMIVEALAAGRSIEQLLADFPYLEEPDIREALAFAARLAQGHEIRLAS